MKAIAAESRDNLDHLHRARKNPQQSQLKKRVAPAAPTGNRSITMSHTVFRLQVKKPGFVDFFLGRVMGQVSYCKNSAADDGDNGEGDGGPVCLLGWVAITITCRGEWVQQRKDAMGDKRR